METNSSSRIDPSEAEIQSAAGQAEALIRAACDFQAKGMEARQKAREKYRQQETSEDNILRISIDGQIGLIGQKVTDKIEATTDAVSYQLGVSASFLRTHYLITDLILDGDLVEAIVLIRKQLESLARLHELDSKPLEKLKGKVPNINNVLKRSSGKMYGDLSEVAHMSTPRVTELLEVIEHGDLIGPSLLPVYANRSRACFEMNCFVAVYFIGWLIEKLTLWYPGYDNKKDWKLLGKTIFLALKAGVIRDPDAPS
jgi:hypothetical protein